MLYNDYDITLIGSHIRITPMTPDDAEPYARLIFGGSYDFYITKFGKPPETDLLRVLEHKANQELHAIRPIDSDRFLGWICLQHDEDRPDIGIHLIPEAQNKGYGPEAIMLYAAYVHSFYSLSRLYIHTTEKNKHCQRMIDKIGGVFDRTGNLLDCINLRSTLTFCRKHRA